MSMDFFLPVKSTARQEYEEAAALGLMAGINAALKVLGREPLILRRNEAYIGVMIDDLVIVLTSIRLKMSFPS